MNLTLARARYSKACLDRDWLVREMSVEHFDIPDVRVTEDTYYPKDYPEAEILRRQTRPDND